MLLKRKQMQSKTRLDKNNRGVTLVEVIAVISVLSVVMAAVTGFMLTSTKMSAQVSNGATVAAREQTAVEFINKTLQGMQAGTIGVTEPLEDQNENAPEYFLILCKVISSDNGSEEVPLLYAKDGKVVYQNGNNEIELCSGEIYFENIEADTVTYNLNGTKHVVHLRVA